MQPEVTLTVLTELGVLVQTPGAGYAEAQPDSAPALQDHAFLDHAPLWDYVAKTFISPFADAGLPPLCRTLPAGTRMEQALEHTRLIVFLGAADTPAFRLALGKPDTLILVFDDSPGRVANLAQAVGLKTLAGRAQIFLGRIDQFTPPLGKVLPQKLFNVGFPVFFTLHPERDASTAALSLTHPVRLIETLYFRYELYSLSGQANNRGLPLRPIQRGLFYDQQLHAYQNSVDFFSRPDISPLRRAFQGETAILVAAGPDLPEQIPFLREAHSKAVIIAVNNALKPLLAGGVCPHFVVANDTSLATLRSWEGLPQLKDTALVAHCLTNLGREIFPLIFLFGMYRKELFGQRPSMRLHGSVITTAFSLARHMGVARCILVGAQLSSDNPWRLSYSRGSIHEAPPGPEKPLTNAYPQLVPAVNALGLLRYTTPNFLDAALWFLEEIRSSDIPCVNMTDQSLVLGPGVQFDPAPEIADTGRLTRRLRQVFSPRKTARPVGTALQSLHAECEFWSNVAQAAGLLAKEHGPGFTAQAMAMLKYFDQCSVSYLVQRYEDFNNWNFHQAVFQGQDEARRAEALRGYLSYVERMAQGFAAVLNAQQAALRDFSRTAQDV